MAILKSYKIDFKTKQGSPYKIIKGRTQQKDVTKIHIYEIMQIKSQ